MSLALSMPRIALAPLGFDREALTIAALIALIVAGLVVSVGAWVLLARERRAYETAMANLDAAAVQQQVAGVPEHEHAAVEVVEPPIVEPMAGPPVVEPFVPEPPSEPAVFEPPAETVAMPAPEPPAEPAADTETVVEPSPMPESDATAVLPAVPPPGDDDEAWASDRGEPHTEDPSEEETADEDQPAPTTATDRPSRRRSRRH